MKKNLRLVIFAAITILCVFILGITIYIQMTEHDYEKAIKKSNSEITEDEMIRIKNNFNKIFENDINGNTEKLEKKNPDKDIVYISAQRVEMIPNKYDLNVYIPQINIDGVEIKNANNEIKNIFQTKASAILAETDEYTVYSVKYHVYINDNILSLIIKSNLKEGINSEREIIKTYNYDFEKKKLITIDDIIEQKGLNRNSIQEKITEEIKKQISYEKSISDLGYEVFTRDVNNKMYRVENVTNFILGEKGHLYIIYAYGNTSFTSQLDIVII